MEDRKHTFFIAWIAFWILATFGVMTCCGATSAQPHEDTRREDTLWVARICVHEATWRGVDGDDCGALYQLLLNHRRPGDIGIEHALAGYSRRFYNRTSSRSWATNLRFDQTVAPEGWPSAWPEFPVFAERWHHVVERTARFVYGTEAVPCEGTPWHWGSRDPRLPDRQRAERAIAAGRWREVNCGNTVNAHYEVIRMSTED